MKDSKYYKNKIAKKEVKNKSWLTKLLLSIIILLISLIVCNFDSSLRDKFSEKVLEENIRFDFFNKYYKKFMSNDKDESLEVGNTDNIGAYEESNGSYKIQYDIDSPMDDPLQTFMDDALVFPANLAGLPGLNVPIGLSEDKMPIGMHIIGNDFEEAKIYQLASILEKELNLDLNPMGGKNNE